MYIQQTHWNSLIQNIFYCNLIIIILLPNIHQFIKLIINIKTYFYLLKIKIQLKHFTKNISSPANHLNQWVKYIPKDITSIVDLTGNVGTESIYFAKDYKHFPNINKITTFELDKNVFKQLQENISYTDLDELITPINSDSIQYVIKNKIHGDLFLLDPPWTGADYKQNKQEIFDEYRHKLYLKQKATNPLDTLTLQMSDMTIEQIINKLSPFFKYLALKIPLNEINAPTCQGYKNLLPNFKQKVIYIEAFEQVKYLVIILSH